MGNCLIHSSVIIMGVSQGSVLGPLFFIAYINDIVSIVKYCKLNLFTDDTLIYIVGSDLPLMCKQMNEDLQILLKYCQGNKLKTHPEKFQCMLITTSKRKHQQLLISHPTSVIVTVNGKPLPFQETMKYLGVKIDHILQFDSC
jgi:hypothetical protein